MDPTAFKIGSMPIHWYGVMMGLAFLVGIGNCIYLAWRSGRKSPAAFMSDLGCAMMICGIIGARIAHVAGEWEYYARDPKLIFFLWKGGVVYYGGFIGGAAGVLIFAWMRKEKALALYDVVVVGLPLAHAFGRLGCFLNGCCHGRPWDGILAVQFPPGSPATEVQGTGIGLSSAPVYPVQLYEAGLNLLLYGCLMWLYPRRKADGRIGSMYLVGYPIIRFSMEFLRGDRRLMVGHFTIAQIVSIVLFVVGVTYLVLSHTRGKRQPASDK